MSAETRIVQIRENILKQNDLNARALRQRFQKQKTFAVSMVSSPGAGKTSLLEHMLAELRKEWRVAALVGDLATENDARRLRRSGVEARQILTGTVCHLEASMVEQALSSLEDAAPDFLFIENVGNLVCPAEFDIGEDSRVVVLSVTEGEDKPVKYPLMFRECEAALLNKIDLLPYLDFEKEKAVDYIHQVHPGMPVFEISAKTEEGFEPWIDWLKNKIRQKV